ncbi:MAG: hypothetical protein JNK05_11970 [Myxococcales bacterium]|nr:hypothetical protein [Myxococcales bacterium]
MTYRDDSDALAARKSALETDLAAAKQKLAESEDIASRAARMERELAEVEARLRGEKKRLPMLDNVRVASPCTASWADMKGDDRVRFCGHCEKNVFNLSAMSRDEAEALILASGAKICVRMYRRADGTVLTEDCSVGVRRKRRKQLAAALVGVSAMATAASALASRAGDSRGDRLDQRIEVVQGGVSAPPTITPPQRPSETPVPITEQGRMEMGEPMMTETPTPPRVQRTGRSVSRPARQR